MTFSTRPMATVHPLDAGRGEMAENQGTDSGSSLKLKPRKARSAGSDSEVSVSC